MRTVSDKGYNDKWMKNKYHKLSIRMSTKWKTNFRLLKLHVKTNTSVIISVGLADSYNFPFNILVITRTFHPNGRSIVSGINKHKLKLSLNIMHYIHSFWNHQICLNVVTQRVPIKNTCTSSFFLFLFDCRTIVGKKKE